MKKLVLAYVIGAAIVGNVKAGELTVSAGDNSVRYEQTKDAVKNGQVFNVVLGKHNNDGSVQVYKWEDNSPILKMYSNESGYVGFDMSCKYGYKGILTVNNKPIKVQCDNALDGKLVASTSAGMSYVVTQMFDGQTTINVGGKTINIDGYGAVYSTLMDAKNSAL